MVETWKKNAVLVALCALATVTAALAVGGADGEGAPPVEVTYVKGAAMVSDVVNDLVLDLPDGWYAIVPTGEAVVGTTTIANYDMRRAEAIMPAHSGDVLLPEMAKMDLMSFDLEGRTVEEWDADQRELTFQGWERPDGTQEQGSAVGEVIRYRLAGRWGYACAVEPGTSPVLEFVLPWATNRVLMARLYPADTQELETVVAVLNRIRTLAEEDQGIVRIPTKTADLETALASLQKSIPLPLKACTCNSWWGTDNAGYASNTPITLYLPFKSSATYWMAGGIGSFFGNGCHNNSCNDYYAVDFNRRGNSSCSTAAEDLGYSVYSVASGTAYTYTGHASLGNYVDVYHSSSVVTRYAHLNTISVAYGAAVTKDTKLGTVGSTGNSTGPHLHFGFRVSGTSYCNQCPTCPNGDACKSPQGRKPSPMTTYSGSQSIVDYGCYRGR